MAVTARGGSVTLAQVVQFGNITNHAARFEALVAVHLGYGSVLLGE